MWSQFCSLWAHKPTPPQALLRACPCLPASLTPSAPMQTLTRGLPPSQSGGPRRSALEMVWVWGYAHTPPLPLGGRAQSWPQVF